MEQKQKVVVSVGGTNHCHYQDRQELLAWIESMNDKVRGIILDDNGQLLPTLPWEIIPPPSHIHVTICPGSITRTISYGAPRGGQYDRLIWFGDSSLHGPQVSKIAHDWALCHDLVHCYCKATLAAMQRLMECEHENRLSELFADKVAGIITGYSRERFYVELGW